MTLTNPLDLLYFVLAVAAVWIGVMLTWLLFEAALLAHRANRTVKGALDKVAKLERAIVNIKDRVESSASYLGAIAEGGKMVMGMMNKRGKKKRRKNNEDDE